MSEWNKSMPDGSAAAIGSNGAAPLSPQASNSALSDDNSVGGNDDLSSDAEGVWSPDIEQSFLEALAIYPPCGRRKIILSDEGKMYGRNELIARYIKLRTGKSRSRKQVSSHIQVLARRKSKEIQSHIKDHGARERALQNMATMSSAQIVSATAMHNNKNRVGGGPGDAYMTGGAARETYSAGMPPPLWNSTGLSQDVKTAGVYGSPVYGIESPMSGADMVPPVSLQTFPGIVGPKLRLVEFSAFLERSRDSDSACNKHLFVHIVGNNSYLEQLETIDIRQIYDKFPDKKGGLKELYDKGPQSAFYLVKFWADLNTDVAEENDALYAVSSHYESSVENMTIQLSTKVCSFGKQVVEKLEVQPPTYENGRFVYRILRSPMCEYMTNFINKLKHLPEKYMMNSVLENFTILQHVTNKETHETLLLLAFVFEVSTSVHGAQHIYRLIRD